MTSHRMNNNNHAANEPAFTQRDLDEIWKESYQFNKSTLRLSPIKAKQWADCSVNVIKETERILMAGS